MFCSKCGFELNEGDLYCSKCGQNLLDAPTHNKSQKSNSIIINLETAWAVRIWNNLQKRLLTLPELYPLLVIVLLVIITTLILGLISNFNLKALFRFSFLWSVECLPSSVILYYISWVLSKSSHKQRAEIKIEHHFSGLLFTALLSGLARCIYGILFSRIVSFYPSQNMTLVFHVLFPVIFSLIAIQLITICLNDSRKKTQNLT